MNDSRALAATALLLQYPNEATQAILPTLQGAIRDGEISTAEDLESFVTWLLDTPLLEAQAHYVALFDRKRRACLYLSYYLNGDTRKRGMALVNFKEIYQANGWSVTDEELPDFLPTLLQFTAAGNREVGLELLAAHRPGLVVLEQALRDANSPYARLASVVLRQVRPNPDDADRAEQLIFAGPPAELVGLSPFGAPERVGN